MTPLHRRSLLAASLACALGSAGLAQAETLMGVTSMAEAKAGYQHDLASCRNRTVDQDMKTCRLEAERAYAEAKREVARHGAKGKTRHAKARTAQSATSTSGTSTGTDANAPLSPNK